jgi:L-alanine-DL-glutamate epimerase-like enolase superfamily enzyme
MKISKVEIIPIDIPQHTPFRVSSGGSTASNFVILKILTDEGFEGIGSSKSFGGMNPSRESAMLIMKDIASEVLLGQDPLNTDLILNNVEARVFESWPILAHFDYALYDLKGKILNVPVYQLLGGLCREEVPLEWIIILDDPEVQAEIALKYLKAGFHSLKLHVGGDHKMAVKRFRTVREAVGPDIPIGIDLAEVCKTHDALRLIEELVPYNLHFVEQPFAAYDIDSFVDIKGRTSVPLVGDASARSVVEVHNMINRRAADIFHTLLGRIGGLRKATKYTNLIEAANLDYAICVLGTGISHAAGAHFAVSRLKSGKILDEFGLIFYLYGGTETKGITTDITKEINGKIENGHLYPPKGPGLGVELNEEMVERYAASGTNKIVVE